MHSVLSALLPDENKATYRCLTLLKNWCPFLSRKIIKMGFEAAVICAINSFQIPLMLALILILISACGDKYKVLVLRWSTKKLNKCDPRAERVVTDQISMSLWM